MFSAGYLQRTGKSVFRNRLEASVNYVVIDGWLQTRPWVEMGWAGLAVSRQDLAAGAELRLGPFFSDHWSVSLLTKYLLQDWRDENYIWRANGWEVSGGLVYRGF